MSRIREWVELVRRMTLVMDITHDMMDAWRPGQEYYNENALQIADQFDALIEWARKGREACREATGMDREHFERYVAEKAHERKTEEVCAREDRRRGKLYMYRYREKMAEGDKGGPYTMSDLVAEDEGRLTEAEKAEL